MFAASKDSDALHITQLKFWSEDHSVKTFDGGSAYSSTVQLEPWSRIIGFKASFGVQEYLSDIDQYKTHLCSI